MDRSGFGIPLFDTKKAKRAAHHTNFFFKNALFTAADFAMKLERLIDNEEDFKTVGLKLRCSVRTAGGAAKAIDTIKNTYV